MTLQALASHKIIAALFLASAAPWISLSIEAQTAPSIDHYHISDASEHRIPKNLARWNMGASLVLVKNRQFIRIQVQNVGHFDESVLLSDNSALTYTILKGEHDYIVDLGSVMKVSRFFFNNESATGSMQIMSSKTLDPIESNNWATLTQPVEFSEGVIPSATFTEIETRYLLVHFNISKKGRIGHFGATGP